MEITVCIGSSCHLKGSRDVVAILQRLIDLNGLKDQIELKGAFCMGECAQNGVCVCIDGERYKVWYEDAQSIMAECRGLF